MLTPSLLSPALRAQPREDDPLHEDDPPSHRRRHTNTTSMGDAFHHRAPGAKAGPAELKQGTLQICRFGEAFAARVTFAMVRRSVMAIQTAARRMLAVACAGRLYEQWYAARLLSCCAKGFLVRSSTSATAAATTAAATLLLDESDSESMPELEPGSTSSDGAATRRKGGRNSRAMRQWREQCGGGFSPSCLVTLGGLLVEQQELLKEGLVSGVEYDAEVQQTLQQMPLPTSKEELRLVLQSLKEWIDNGTLNADAASSTKTQLLAHWRAAATGGSSGVTGSPPGCPLRFGFKRL